MAQMHIRGLTIYDRSLVEKAGTTYALARGEASGEHLLVVSGDGSGFAGNRPAGGETTVCSLTPANAAALRERLPWLRPAPLGLRASAGMGDRLGLATPGHVRAVRGTGLAPIFAQQSVRENNRTRRTPQQVMDDAMWGVFQEGWRDPWGADADHLKTPADAASFAAAGFSFYTIDPGDHVDNDAATASEPELMARVAALPWDILQSSPRQLEMTYLAEFVRLGVFGLSLDRPVILRAAAKYGRAVAHTVTMYYCLRSLLGSQPFDLEVSVDETALPTSVYEHFYIASELRRLGVAWDSLAPRYLGRFEKGVDYIGSLAEFEAELNRHAVIMRHFGGYKISLHSGSDKFSIYRIAARLTRGLVHLKTAGTSYLEALRVIAQCEPGLFRDILALAHERYETDRATYHVSADLAKVAAPQALSDAQLPDLLNQFDARQVLHVTFGAVLDRFAPQLKAALRTHEEAYNEAVRVHFTRHLDPLKPQ